MRNLKRLLLNSLIVLFAAAAGQARQMSTDGGDLVITKDLFGAPGSVSMTQGDYSLDSVWGEPVSGNIITEPTYTIISGYFGGRFGNAQAMSLLSSKVGTLANKTFFQDRIQIGVQFDAPVEIVLSDQFDAATIPFGVRVSMAMDHLGRSFNTPFAVTVDTDSLNHKITLHPQGAWLGNTLYDVQVTPALLSVDGFPLDQNYHLYFVTMLDHRQENVVLEPVVPSGLTAETGPTSVGVAAINIPMESLSDFSTVVISRDPLTAPLRVDPKIIQEANDKARAAGGPYRVPLSIQEVGAYNTQGNMMGPLSRAAQITFNYGSGLGAPSVTAGLIRPQTLSLWVLDETHRLWVKMPASKNSLGDHTVTAPIASFSVFALMGSADGSAVDSYAYPVPWRPHGPNAGTQPGQTGTEADGINFSSIPSECTIKIYTITGELVRTIQHSDTGILQNRDTWDVKTIHGDPVASGVYLWRVESSVDGKTGKLMVIR